MRKDSLARKTLLQLGLRVAVVILLMTAVSYIHVTNVITDQSLEYLEKYVTERGQRDREIFRLAEDNHKAIKQQLLKLISTTETQAPSTEFYKKFKKLPDGSTRTRLEGFDPATDPFGFIGKGTNIDDELMRRILIFCRLSSQYGAAWHHRLQNIYFTTPENLLVGYWPEFPAWAHELPADFNMTKEEYVWIADKQRNPKRESVWTGLFFDIGASVLMVSVETPVDYKGRHIATIGHDILLNELFGRTLDVRLKGSYNLIFRSDGRLIVHPNKMEKIKQQKGYFNIHESDDANLKKIFELVTSNNKTIIENSDFDEYLAINRIEEPGWYFVTVYPKYLLTEAALGTARLVLFLGLFSLFLELAILWWVLKKNVSVPLLGFLSAVEQGSKGNLDITLDTSRRDELGEFGKSFNRMTRVIRERTDELEENRFLLQNTIKEKELESQKNRMLFDASPIGLALLDNKGRFVDVNQAYADIVGRTIEECLTLSYFDISCVKNNADGQGLIESLKDVGHYGPCEERFRHRDGYNVPVRHSAAMQQIECESFIWSSVENISDVEKANAELEYSRIRFEAMFESISDAVIMVDTERKIVNINQAVTRIFGYSKSDLLGKTTQLLYATPESYSQTGKQRFNRQSNVSESAYEIQYRRKDGVIFWGETLGTKIVSGEGDLFGFVGIIRDVTARKLAENSLKSALELNEKIIDSSPIGIAIFNAHGQCIAANSSIASMIGATHEQVLGQNYHELQSWKKSGLYDAAVTSLEKNTKLRHEFKVVTTFGKYAYFDAILVPFRQHLEQHLLLMLDDISVRKTVEAELVQHRDHLEELVEERTTALKEAQNEVIKGERLATLGQLTATVSHELRNPLGAITPAVYIVEKLIDKSNIQISKALERIKRNIERCDRIIDELLDFTRTSELHKTVVVFDEWVQDFLSEYRFPEDIVVVTQLKLDGISIAIDTSQMWRAFINILSNSVQAIELRKDKNEARIEISTISGEGRYGLRVRDNGNGIKQEQVSRIFDPLYSTKTFGIGLGMTVVEKVIASHGGTVEVESEEGRGTTITLWLLNNADDK